MDTSFVGEHLDAYTFQQLISDALDMVPSKVDKRQGSIIYDTLAVGDVQLAQGFVRLKGYYLDCYALTAREGYLDLRVAEAGVHRYMETPAVKLGTFLDNNGQPVSIPMEARFSTAIDTDALIYTVTAVYAQDGAVISGSYRLTCETPGMAGNNYVGPLIPITHLSEIASAEMTDLLIPARDREDDDALLARYLEEINRPAFGGNIAQYRKWILEMDGVGAVQVYPVWNGGGTVKVSIIGADYNPASSALIDDVQTKLDPEHNHGQGLGIAPIGHFVTVATPNAVQINVQANLTLRFGITVGQVEAEIRKSISAYLLERRKLFGASSNTNLYAVNIYRARMSTAMMQVDGVENVTGVLINGADDDLMLAQTAFVQQLPMDGAVTLNAV